MKRLFVTLLLVLGLMAPVSVAEAAPVRAEVAAQTVAWPVPPAWCAGNYAARRFQYQTMCIDRYAGRLYIANFYGRQLVRTYPIRVVSVPYCGYVPAGNYLMTSIGYQGRDLAFGKKLLSWVVNPGCQYRIHYSSAYRASIITYSPIVDDALSRIFKVGYPVVVR